MFWETIARPGVFGEKKKDIFQEFNAQYGKHNWRIAHAYNNTIIPFIKVCQLFEESYFQDSLRREELWLDLKRSAKNVYDIDETDILSGLDYTKQNNIATHLQDIAIRNVFKRKKWFFEGEELIQIRSKAKPFGYALTPGRVPFHQPEQIITPHIQGWWDDNSVEDFYQSNKLLQIKKF